MKNYIKNIFKRVAFIAGGIYEENNFRSLYRTIADIKNYLGCKIDEIISVCQSLSMRILDGGNVISGNVSTPVLLNTSKITIVADNLGSTDLPVSAYELSINGVTTIIYTPTYEFEGTPGITYSVKIRAVCGQSDCQSLSTKILDGSTTISGDVQTPVLLKNSKITIVADNLGSTDLPVSAYELSINGVTTIIYTPTYEFEGDPGVVYSVKIRAICGQNDCENISMVVKDGSKSITGDVSIPVAIDQNYVTVQAERKNATDTEADYYELEINGVSRIVNIRTYKFTGNKDIVYSLRMRSVCVTKEPCPDFDTFEGYTIEAIYVHTPDLNNKFELCRLPSSSSSSTNTTTTTTTTPRPSYSSSRSSSSNVTTTTTTTIPPNTFNVTNNFSGNYIINGASNPTLGLTAGQTYTFNIFAIGHRFWIKTTESIGTVNAYMDGVSNNGTDNGTITFTVPSNVPSTLYYNCELHSSMKGTINIATPNPISSSSSSSSRKICFLNWPQSNSFLVASAGTVIGGMTSGAIRWVGANPLYFRSPQTDLGDFTAADFCGGLGNPGSNNIKFIMGERVTITGNTAYNGTYRVVFADNVNAATGGRIANGGGVLECW